MDSMQYERRTNPLPQVAPVRGMMAMAARHGQRWSGQTRAI